MTPVDLYCERLAPGSFDEPLNTVTNAAILVAAWLAWRYARRSGQVPLGVVLLIALMVAFGFGSFLFHSFANTLTRLLDVLPIAAFIAAYLWLYLRGVLAVPAAIAGVAVAVVTVAAIGARQVPGVLNGSLTYAPALVLVLGLGAIHWWRAQRERASLLGAAGVLFVALVFRTVDRSLCASFPVGTHFIWHLLAALGLYLAMRALIANLPREPPLTDPSAGKWRLPLTFC